MKRRDGSKKCQDPTWTPPTSSNPPSDDGKEQMSIDPDVLIKLLGGTKEDLPENEDCENLTGGLLKFGMCHAGVGADTVPTNLVIEINGIGFATINLRHGYAGMFTLKPR